MWIVILFCVQVLKHLDLLSTLQCYFISVLFTADIISTVEFNYSGDLLATGDKGGRVVIFQREQEVSDLKNKSAVTTLLLCCTVSLHLLVLWSLNGWVVFSEDDVSRIYKYLPRAEFGNVAWWWFHPLTAFKKTLTKYSGFVMCTYYAQYHKCRIAFEVSPKLYT